MTSWKRPRADLGTRRRHPDDDAFAPALMGRLKGCAHHRHISRGVKGVICAPTGQLDKMGNQIALYFGWVDEISHAKLLAHLNLAGVQVDPDDLISTRKAQTLDHVQPDPAEAKHNGAAANLDLGGVDHRANACGDPTTDIANFIKRRVLAHFCQCNFGGTTV